MNAVAQPNIVIIYADDLGRGDLGCFGADDLATPAIDAIAADGIRLPNWYSNSPVCSPSRAALLTGRYPAHAGVETILGGTRHTPGLPAQQTLASRLGERGYRTGIFGKWHLGAAEEYSPSRYGFDESFGFRAGCVDYYSHIYYWGDHNPVHDLWDDDHEVWHNGEYLTTAIGERASRFIADNADRPFFCYVPFNAPHYPLHAPKEYLDRFPELPPHRRIMAAMIAAMDDAVGRIVETLDEHGLRENTLIFVSSDNGPSAESRNWLDGEEVSYQGGSTGGLRGTKGSLFEGGIRVPAIVSWPAELPRGVDYEGVGAMMDVLPTILEAVDGGGEPSAVSTAGPTGIDGHSLLSRLRSLTEPAQRSVCWSHDGQWAVRRGRYKLVQHAQEGMTPPYVVEHALYDLDQDPGEQNDISRLLPDEALALRTELERFRERHAEWVESAR